MRVSVYSREAIEHIIAEGSFPDNTAVISFCDPELKHIDKGYSRVDYSAACDDVFYCEMDDLDLDYLPEADAVEVLSPHGLREQIADILRNALKKYDP